MCDKEMYAFNASARTTNGRNESQVIFSEDGIGMWLRLIQIRARAFKGLELYYTPFYGENNLREYIHIFIK